MHRTLWQRSRYRIAGICILAWALVITACGDGGWRNSPSVVTTGDTTKGRAVFIQTCTPCHTPTRRPSVGPGLAGLFDEGGPSIPDGVDYGGKLSNGQAITVDTVADWIEHGGEGKIGKMPPQPLTHDEILDVIAYLATLNK